jgi:hypothetical protein
MPWHMHHLPPAAALPRDCPAIHTLDAGHHVCGMWCMAVGDQPRDIRCAIETPGGPPKKSTSSPSALRPAICGTIAPSSSANALGVNPPPPHVVRERPGGLCPPLRFKIERTGGQSPPPLVVRCPQTGGPPRIKRAAALKAVSGAAFPCFLVP